MTKIKILLLILVNSYLLYSIESYKIHNVKDGETLWRISKSYNVPLEVLCKINKITDVTKIKKGDKLKIPVKESFQNTENKKNVKKEEQKKYVNYYLPIKGNIKPLVTSNFRGVIIFTDNNIQNRNVFSVGEGTVIHVDNLKGYGITIFIKHSNEIISIYSGLDRVYFKKGDKIASSQLIGTAGIIARYSKYGLIFSLQKNGSYLKYDFEKNKFYYLQK
ncbi:MAG TPA: LysM peptidoglycan-binding domain-containing M23 family metallopeptidase [Spirochaetota bacterium]|nr:LysM peptidoglycan-binding domain-containing M23 family metallopeptidase [Spirochaetota bacterium]HOL57922.1 LysM peptidoglycan-binding domain-containing M23 family metallopeptidase [Spirochaetota bacterium]HPP04766.1 LysM peptidoglycan-binding domain-containing M23 family metallopeptidase [Spirochaetota bacterium]